MNTAATTTETTDLFWSERGAIACAKHAPYNGSDTWRWERWQPMTADVLAIYIAESGKPARCESCESIERRANETAAMRSSVGNVVTLDGNRRRFVIVDCVGGFSLRALSGAWRGSGPTGIDSSRVRMSADQTVRFEGASAGKLRKAFTLAASHLSATDCAALLARVVES